MTLKAVRFAALVLAVGFLLAALTGRMAVGRLGCMGMGHECSLRWFLGGETGTPAANRNTNVTNGRMARRERISSVVFV